MNIYLISPVRLGESSYASRYVEELQQQGHKVYYPHRDTRQDDDTGFRICLENYFGIASADEVHVVYNANSQGQHFDLGIAFALGKPLKVVTVEEAESQSYPEQRGGKSYLRMMSEWEKRTIY